MPKLTQTIVLAIGGTTIVPNSLDHEFLHKLYTLVDYLVTERNLSVVCTVGGGAIARSYQTAASTFPHISNDDLDQLGITVCTDNTDLVSLILRPFGNAIQINPEYEPFGPGRSSDWIAVTAAKYCQVPEVIFISDIDYIYTDDPVQNPNARKYDKTTWTELEQILDTNWTPGMRTPIDPLAIQTAKAAQLEAQFIHKDAIHTIRDHLDGKEVVGTHVSM